jgi:hypothetical protein
VTRPGWDTVLDSLPVCPARGLPIPFSSGRDPHGAGLFGVNDPDAKLACAARRLCGVCGREIARLGAVAGGELVFLAAGKVPARPVFTDPPMHNRCAEAALALCPFIARPRVPSRTHPGAGPKPGWFMWVTTTYELVPGRRSLVDFLPGPAVRIRVFAYQGDALEEVT